MESAIYFLMFISAAFLFLAVTELLALAGMKIAVKVMLWYDDYTCWRYLQRKKRFWKRVKREGNFNGN